MPTHSDPGLNADRREMVVVIVGANPDGDDTIKSYMDPATDPAAFFRVGADIP